MYLDAVNPSIREAGQVDLCKFKDNIVYIVSFRQPQLQSKSLSKTKEKTNPHQEYFSWEIVFLK